MSEHQPDFTPLWNSYSIAAEWVRTADQKASIMLAFISASAAAVVAYPLATRTGLSPAQLVIAGAVYASALLCAWFCLLALLPRLETADQQVAAQSWGFMKRIGAVVGLLVRSLVPTGNGWRPGNRSAAASPLDPDNALYFGALAEADVDAIFAVYARFETGPDDLRRALAGQIRALSVIARQKYVYLQFATAWLIVATAAIALLWTHIVLVGPADGT